MPVVEIDAKSLSVHHSWLIDAFRLDFNLVFWTDNLKNAAIEDLERLYAEYDEKKGEQQSLSTNQIQVRCLFITTSQLNVEYVLPFRKSVVPPFIFYFVDDSNGGSTSHLELRSSSSRRYLVVT